MKFLQEQKEEVKRILDILEGDGAFFKIDPETVDFEDVEQVKEWLESINNEENNIQIGMANDEIIDFNILKMGMSAVDFCEWLLNNHYQSWRHFEIDADFVDISSVYYSQWEAFKDDGYYGFCSYAFDQYRQDILDTVEQIQAYKEIIEKLCEMDSSINEQGAEDFLETLIEEFSWKDIKKANLYDLAGLLEEREKEKRGLEIERFI